MAIEDLDLEFEDEGESQKGDALNVEVDLSFSASPESVKELQAQKKGAPVQRAQAAPTPRPMPKKAPTSNNVANINQAKPRVQAQVQAKPTNQVRPTPDYANDSVGDIAELRAEIESLKQQMQSVQHQASIKIAVAEAERDYMVEFVSNAKVMDHQVTQILTRINKKVPALNSEVQTIKKYVNEFIKKSVPGKKGGE